MQKALAGRIPIVAAVSPSSLAVHFAAPPTRRSSASSAISG